jgi:hypothetical protein
MTCIDVEVRLDRSVGAVANTVSFTHDGVGHDIYWEHTGTFLPRQPPVMDFALVAMLPYCMHHGLDIRILGSVTRSLIEAAEELIDVWTLWRPDLFRKIQLDATEVAADHAPAGCDAVLAFSGGVDSTFALAANRQQTIGHRSRDVKAGVMIHGFDIPLDQPELFNESARHARYILSEMGSALSTVRTNWRKYCVAWEMSHAFGIAAVLHQYHGATSFGILAADDVYGEEDFPWGNTSVTNPLLSGLSFPIQACGGGSSRVCKVGEIARFESVRSHIRVCWANLGSGLNCGFCDKCVRTRLEFSVAGLHEIPAFPGRLTADMVSRLRITKEDQRRFLLAILNHPGASLLDGKIHQALKRVVNSGKSTGLRGAIGDIVKTHWSALRGVR